MQSASVPFPRPPLSTCVHPYHIYLPKTVSTCSAHTKAHPIHTHQSPTRTFRPGTGCKSTRLPPYHTFTHLTSTWHKIPTRCTPDYPQVNPLLSPNTPQYIDPSPESLATLDNLSLITIRVYLQDRHQQVRNSLTRAAAQGPCFHSLPHVPRSLRLCHEITPSVRPALTKYTSSPSRHAPITATSNPSIQALSSTPRHRPPLGFLTSSQPSTPYKQL